MQLVQGDITKANVDIIVNASNGIGYMGGSTGVKRKLQGVAEAIHYETAGLVEKEAKIVCKKSKCLPRVFCGHKEGEVFITTGATLKCRNIIHAVTMYFPGSKAKLSTIKVLLPKIVELAEKKKAKTLAMPILGAGTGGLSKLDVLKVYEEFFNNTYKGDIKVFVYEYKKED